MKILLTGGGTGGHIFPIIAVAREIRRVYPKKDLKFFYLGPRDEFSGILLSQEGIKVTPIITGKIRRYFSVENFLDLLFKIPFGFIQSFIHIYFMAPDLIFSKGGPGSAGVVIAGRLLRTPVLLHESDIIPGLANKIASKFAMRVFTSFPGTEYFPLKKIVLTGNPIREEVIWGFREAANVLLKITGGRPVIFIIGGSQGAQKINETVLDILPSMVQDFEIIHQCGEKNFKTVEAESGVMLAKAGGKQYYHLYPFLKEEELKQAYAACDLIVSRAGSGSIFEIAGCRKPSIMIPLSGAAQNHQVKNAYCYAESGAAIVMEENNITPHFLLERIKDLVSKPDEMQKMSEKAKAFSKPDAARLIATRIVDYLMKKNVRF